MRWQRAAVVCGALAVLVGTILMGCVDGVTPDCSDAATQCGPNVDGSTDTSSEALLPEAAKPDSAADAGDASDADAGDALDAGDGG